MKRLFAAFLAVTLAFSAVSCDELLDPGTDDPNSTIPTYIGEMKVSKDGEVTYEASEKKCEAKYYTDSMTLTMYKMKFATLMPLSLDIVFPNIKFDKEAGYYFAEQVTPTAIDSEPITYVKITNVIIAKAGTALFVKFDCTMYGTTTYEVVYVSGDIERPNPDGGNGDNNDDNDDDVTPPSNWDSYNGELKVLKDTMNIYADTAATARALVNEEAKSISATLSGVKFSAHMPLTLDLTFSDVAYDAEQERYCAATIVPTDANGDPITMVAIKDLSIYNPSSDDITIIFTCTMAGNEYKIIYSTFDSPSTDDGNDNGDDNVTSIHPTGSYYGDMSVKDNGAEVYQDSLALVYVDNAATPTSIDILMKGVKFSPYMPVTIDLDMEGVEYNETTKEYFATDLTPNDGDGAAMTTTIIKNLSLKCPTAISIEITFDLIYNGKTYAISYSAEQKRDTVDRQ